MVDFLLSRASPGAIRLARIGMAKADTLLTLVTNTLSLIGKHSRYLIDLQPIPTGSQISSYLSSIVVLAYSPLVAIQIALAGTAADIVQLHYPQSAPEDR